MNERLRDLAKLDAGEMPLLSVYLDVRPEATGENPQVRAGLTVLKDRLNEIRKTFLPRGEDLDSFDADAKRIEAFVDHEMEPSTKGVAIFACHAYGVFEAIEVGVHFENQVAVGPTPDLYQLARLADDYETSVVALVDTNMARLFVYRQGTFTEVDGTDDDPTHYRKRSTGGWSQARYQRHIDKHRKEFAQDVARAIEELSASEGAQHVVLAGDEVAITALQEQLPATTAEMVREIVRLDIRASREDVAAEVEPILREAEAEAALSTVEHLIGEVRRGGLGAAGVAETQRALEYGQVDVLVIDDTAPIDEDARTELVRRASATGATVEVVQGSEALLRLGGVGALLRYRT